LYALQREDDSLEELGVLRPVRIAGIGVERPISG